jgi:hypothetical protein
MSVITNLMIFLIILIEWNQCLCFQTNTEFNWDTVLFVLYMQNMGWTNEGSSSCPGTSKIYLDIGFEVYRAVTMKNAVFWDVAPCRTCVN